MRMLLQHSEELMGFNLRVLHQSLEEKSIVICELVKQEWDMKNVTGKHSGKSGDKVLWSKENALIKEIKEMQFYPHNLIFWQFACKYHLRKQLELIEDIQK